jgi:hypothetical protein
VALVVIGISMGKSVIGDSPKAVGLVALLVAEVRGMNRIVARVAGAIVFGAQ